MSSPFILIVLAGTLRYHGNTPVVCITISIGNERIAEKTDLNSGRNRESGNVEHVARTVQDQYIRRVVILVTFNLVCLEKLREKRQQKL